MATTQPDVSLRIGAELAELRNALNQGLAELRKFRAEAEKASQAARIRDTGIANFTSQVQGGIKSLKALAAGFVALKGVQLFSGFVQQGIEFNKTLETAELGIASLIAAQSDLVDAQGNAVEGQDALTVAIGLSKDQMHQLRIAGLQTAATTTQLVEAFQQAVGPGLAAGLGLDEVRKQTIQITQAATALGVPMNQLAQEIRAIFSGDIDKNARVGSILFTPEQIRNAKEAGTFVELLNTRLESFALAGKKSADTFETIASNAKEAFQTAAGVITEGFFDTIKKSLLEATEGIFDTKTLRIAEPFEDLASVLKEIVDLVGTGIGDGIRGAVELAQQLSGYFKENRAEISELVQSVGLLVGQFFDLLGFVAKIVLGLGDAGVKTNALATVIQTIAILLAGVQDGFRAIASVVVFLGSLIVKVVLAPLEHLTAIIADVVSIANEEAAAQLRRVQQQINDIRNGGFEASRELIQPLLDGKSAVAEAVAQLDQLKKKAEAAGQAQKNAAAQEPGATGRVAGSKVAPEKKFSLPELRREADESFRIVKDAIDRETKALDQALEDRKVTITEWYAEKQRLAEEDFANEKARLDRERAILQQHLAKLNATGSSKSEDRERVLKDTVKTKNELAKIDADLLILERERATTISNITREATQKEKEYQKLIENTRAALLRAQNKDLEARLIEIDQTRRDLLEKFKGDAASTDLANQLFNAETLKAKTDDLQTQIDKIFARYNEEVSQMADKVKLGVVGQVDSEEQLQAVRVKSIEQVQNYIQQLEALAATTNDPEILQKLEGAKVKLEQMRQEQSKLLTDIKDAGSDALGTFFNDIVSGSKDAGDALKDLVRNFAAAVGKMASEALAQNIIGDLFRTTSSAGGGGGTGGLIARAFQWFAGLFHQGGIVGQGTRGRMVPAFAFADAPRYHAGGMVGLAPNEVPAVLQKGEEVVTRNDPRHAANGGGAGTRVINVIDPALVEDYLTSSAGEQSILNVIGRNPGYVKQTLGG